MESTFAHLKPQSVHHTAVTRSYDAKAPPTKPKFSSIFEKAEHQRGSSSRRKIYNEDIILINPSVDASNKEISRRNGNTGPCDKISSLINNRMRLEAKVE